METVKIKVANKFANFVAIDIRNKKESVAWGRTINSLIRKVEKLGLDASTDVIFSWVAKPGKKYIFSSC